MGWGPVYLPLSVPLNKLPLCSWKPCLSALWEGFGTGAVCLWKGTGFGNQGLQQRALGRGLSSSCLAALYGADGLWGSSVLGFPSGNSLPAIVLGSTAACGTQPAFLSLGASSLCPALPMGAICPCLLEMLCLFAGKGRMLGLSLRAAAIQSLPWAAQNPVWREAELMGLVPMARVGELGWDVSQLCRVAWRRPTAASPGVLPALFPLFPCTSGADAATGGLSPLPRLGSGSGTCIFPVWSHGYSPGPGHPQPDVTGGPRGLHSC